MSDYEFILVIHEDHRRVVVDGRSMGFTNQTIMVSRGPHRVTLEAPVDYSPSFRRRIVRGTTPAKPMFLTFERRAASELAARPDLTA